MKPYRILPFLCFIFACSGQSQQKEQPATDLQATEKDIVCFVYHRFGDSRFPSTNISTKDFEAHLQYLKQNDFNVLTLSEALAYLKSAESAKKTVVITIDDGYKSFYKNALPLLKKYSMPATLFINTETVGSGDYMNWDELKATMNAGIEIGNHTHSHSYFLNEPAATRYQTFERELEQSQTIISKHLKKTPDVFAYPYGEFDEKMKSIVKEAGFKGAAAQNSGVLHNDTDLHLIPRFPISEAYGSLPEFKSKASMRALKVVKKTPENGILSPDNLRPALTLTFSRAELQTNRLQCFIQGSECQFQISEKEDNTVSVRLTPSSDLSKRRRTLYTITVPDTTGAWRWYSHLWINTQVK